jgi:hypothetical protein
MRLQSRLPKKRSNPRTPTTKTASFSAGDTRAGDSMTRLITMSRLVKRGQPPLLLYKALGSAKKQLFSKHFTSVGVDLKPISRLALRCLPPPLLHKPLESANMRLFAKRFRSVGTE